MSKLKVRLDLVVDGDDVEVLVVGTVSRFVRGRSSGLPENCYPDEGGEAEVESATVDGKPFELTKEQEERAREALCEAAADEDPPDPPDYED